MNWNGKKVLITGSEGFIGSHLTERMVELGAKVTAFVLYNSFNSWGWLDSLDKKIKDNIEVFTGDVRDELSVKKATTKKDYVFHLAALIGIPYSYVAPYSYVDTNVKGTLNILQASLENNVTKVLHTSTSETYGTAQYVPMDEKHPLQGQSPYSASKIGADMMAESYFRSFNLPVSIVRPFNTFGPRQSARAVIPTIITQILSNKKSIKLGNLETTRDLTFVKDTAEGFVKIAESDKTLGTVLNLGTGQDVSIGDLANLIMKIIGKKVDIETDRERVRPDKSEVERLCSSNKKAFELAKWQPKYSLEEGLKETIKWFDNKSNLSLYKTDIYNV